MLGLEGEGLQFTPAFFWLSDIVKCSSSSYHMGASLRGLKISFAFSQIEPERKTANMEVRVTSMPNAVNDKLTEKYYEIRCL